MTPEPTSSTTSTDSDAAGIVQMSAATRGVRRRPRAALRRIVTRAGRGDDWRFVTERGPAVLPFAENLARYLTESVPALNGERPLLMQCVCRGMDCWLKAHAQDDHEQRRFLAFIRGALYPLPGALEWTLSRTNGDQTIVWNPIEQCMMDWWRGKGGVPEARRRNRPTDSAYVALNPADYRLIVLVRFLARDSISLTPLSTRLDELVTRFG